MNGILIRAVAEGLEDRKVRMMRDSFLVIIVLFFQEGI